MQQSESQPQKVTSIGIDTDTGGRIKSLFESRNLTVYEANQMLGYSRSSKLYKVAKGETKPSYETLIDLISAFPEVSADWLLTGQGPMLRGTAGPAPALGVVGVARGGSLVDRVLTVTVDKDGEENTSLVTVRAQAGYTRQHNEAVFLQQLRHYRIPGFEGGTYRAFEVSGDSMEPTLNHRDIVVCSIVEELRLLEPGEVYVVVTTESVMLKRIKDRVRATDTEVLLHSDNPHRKPFGLETRDIIQLWRVRGYVSSYLPSAPDITIERLWEVIEQLGYDKGEVRRHLDENATSGATH